MQIKVCEWNGITGLQQLLCMTRPATIIMLQFDMRLHRVNTAYRDALNSTQVDISRSIFNRLIER